MGILSEALFFVLGVLRAAWNFIFRRVQVTPWCVVTPDAASADTLPGADVKEIAVIGAGPSGLVAAKHLTAAGYKVTIYEKSSSIGGTQCRSQPAGTTTKSPRSGSTNARSWGNERTIAGSSSCQRAR